MEAPDHGTTDNRNIERAFGDALRQFRQAQGLSQEALGFKSGYHRTYISLLERGQKSPSLQAIFRLAKALEIEPSGMVRQIERTVVKNGVARSGKKRR